jgi:hypothetical protein
MKRFIKTAHTKRTSKKEKQKTIKKYKKKDYSRIKLMDDTLEPQN